MEENKKNMPRGEDTMPMVESSVQDMVKEEAKTAMPARPPSQPFQNTVTLAPQPANDQYDYFISYAHTNSGLIGHFVENILRDHKQIKLFYDRDNIPPGGLWIKQISDAIQKAKKVLIFLSPDYNNSPVCWDEFQCAKLMEYTTKKQLIQTIYLFNDPVLPPMMGIYSWIDCREGDINSFKNCIAKLLPAGVAF